MSFFKKIIERLVSEELVPTDERRQSVRLNFRTEIEVAVGDKRIPAQLLNLTFTGVCVELSEELSEDQDVTLHRDEVGPAFRGTVLWSKAKDEKFLCGIGCELDEEHLLESWLYQTLVQAGFEAEFVNEKRLLVRVPGRVQCKLKEIGGADLGSGNLLNLSTGGALLEWSTELASGIEVEFETGSLSEHKALSGTGRIVSVRPGDGRWLCGVEFSKVNQDDIQGFMEAMLKA